MQPRGLRRLPRPLAKPEGVRAHTDVTGGAIDEVRQEHSGDHPVGEGVEDSHALRDQPAHDVGADVRVLEGRQAELVPTAIAPRQEERKGKGEEDRYPGAVLAALEALGMALVPATDTELGGIVYARDPKGSPDCIMWLRKGAG